MFPSPGQQAFVQNSFLPATHLSSNQQGSPALINKHNLINATSNAFNNTHTTTSKQTPQPQGMTQQQQMIPGFQNLPFLSTTLPSTLPGATAPIASMSTSTPQNMPTPQIMNTP